MNKENNHTQTSLAGGEISEEEKLRQAKKAEMQKKYKLMSILLVCIIVIAVVALISSYNKCKTDGHTWVSATCTNPRICSVCKETEGNPLGHNWEVATCETPKTCSICGVVEGTAIGHDWMDATKESPAICSLCGTTTGSQILPTLIVTNLCWGGDGSPQYGCQNNTATLSFPTWDSFSSSKIDIKNANQETIPIELFSFEWLNGTVYITPSEALPLAIYDITFVCDDGDTTFSLCYGYEGEIYQESNDMGWFDFSFQNWKNGLYLVRTNSGLETSTSYSDRSTFSWSREMCGLEVAADGYAYPSNNGKMVQFTTKTYVLHGGEDLWVFTYNGWNMAADSNGLVYFTKELTDECYWVFAP